MQNTQKTMSGHGFTQFELTTTIVKNLKHFKDLNLTPVTKLVLIELSTHYNETENGAVVFPSLEYIAETIGQSLTSVKQAIKDLINAGLIIKTKRSNVKGNFNKYLFTSKITGLKSPDRINYTCDTIKVQNSTSEWAQNEFFKQSENELFLYEQKKETKKEPTVNKNLQVDSNSIEIEGFKILKEYAQKNCTSTPEKYLNWILKHKDVQKKILSDFKTKENAKKRALRSVEETQDLIKKYENMKKNCVMPSECEAWKELGQKIKACRG